MVEPLRHRQTKEAATDMFEPTATAPHLDSTNRSMSVARAKHPHVRSSPFATEITRRCKMSRRARNGHALLRHPIGASRIQTWLERARAEVPRSFLGGCR